MTLAISRLGTELLDDPQADPTDVDRSLRNIERANRWLGGHWAVRWGVARLLRGRTGPVTVLDVGTGSGDVPEMLQRWGRARGLDIVPLALELSPIAARLARERGLPVVLGCGGEIPIADRGVDLVVASQIAHHLERQAAGALFRECGRVARLGVVVADLRRSRLAAAGFQLAGRLLAFDRFTLSDGVTSLRRGFSVPELSALATGAGARAKVRRRPGSRVVAVWSCGP